MFKDASVPDWKDFHGFFPLAPLQFQPKTNKYKSKNTNQFLVGLGLEVFLFWLMTVMKNDFSERNFWESIWDCSSIKPRARITLNSLPRLYHNFSWKLVSLINKQFCFRCFKSAHSLASHRIFCFSVRGLKAKARQSGNKTHRRGLSTSICSNYYFFRNKVVAQIFQMSVE